MTNTPEEQAHINDTRNVSRGIGASELTDATEAEAKEKAAEASEKAVEEKKESKKLTIGQKIKKEVQHYWDGTKLLAAEVRISSQLAFKMAAGYELSRREHRQVCRTWTTCYWRMSSLT